MSHYKALSLAAALIVFGGCATNPVTGKRELSLISEKQEVQIGKEQAQEAAEQMGLVNDPGLQQYVSSIGMELAKHSERILIDGGTSALVDHRLVRRHAERLERRKDLGIGAGDFARRIEILDAHDPPSAGRARKEPTPDRRDERAEMQPAGRRGREAAVVGG